MCLARFELRPYRSSTTYHNLKARGEGVFHVTDDVLLLAQTAIGVAAAPPPATRPADVVAGRILLDACRYYEFRVVELDDREERTTIVAETAAQGQAARLLRLQSGSACCARGCDPGDSYRVPSA